MSSTAASASQLVVSLEDLPPSLRGPGEENRTTHPNSQGDQMTPNQGQGRLIGLLTRFTTRPNIWWDISLNFEESHGTIFYHAMLSHVLARTVTHRAGERVQHSAFQSPFSTPARSCDLLAIKFELFCHENGIKCHV